MSDKYQGFTTTPIGKLLVKNLGLPDPMKLERYTEGAPLVDGTVLVGGRGRLAESLPGLLDTLGIASTAVEPERGRKATRASSSTPPASPRSADLVGLRDFFTPLMRSLEALRRASSSSAPRPSSSRAPSGSPSARSRASPAASARRSAAAAPSSSSTSPTAPRARPTSTLAFLLSPKSAYVSGQVVRIGAHGDRRPTCPRSPTSPRPLAGKVALVTGASRGIGEQIARVLHRDGATVVGVDVPQAASELQVADEGARRRLAHPRHHRQGRPAAHRPPPQGRSTAASTSSCTTPASPATRSSPTWTRPAGTR